ncbi:MAG TPA: hypothetical protein VHP11_05440 [Tepidisphaeraceae bacterium]|nr:hypothetical protein [Tepidisphaeraceae bacterium]
MIKLEPGNVLLKPSHRKQMNAWLKRSLRLGQRMEDFDVTLSLSRIGHAYEVQARVHDSAGDFGCRCRQRDVRNALRDVAISLASRLHDQRLQVSV